MAFSSMNMFSTSCPTSPLPTEEELKLYHSIDRQLYEILIFNLGRDMSQSMYVMAFLLWLEQQSIGGMTLVKRMLSLSSCLINDLANEAVLCLECVENDEFSYPDNSYELSLLPKIVGKKFTLNTLYQKRVRVLHGVTLMLNQVCGRVFHDINLKAFNARDVTKSAISLSGFEAGPSTFTNSTRQAPHKRVMMQESRDLNEEQCELLSDTLNLNEEGNYLCHDDRTIFLTFSRGYPISEGEVREFFTRKFGDFIEEIHMQEVPKGQQILYARVVAKEAWMIDVVVEGSGTAKYKINGKHVCARKFVSKKKLFAATCSSSDMQK